MSELNSTFVYDLMKPEEAGEVCMLIELVFRMFEAPDFTPAGIAEFFRYANPDAMLARAENHFCYVCRENGEIVGVIEIREFNHISLLFVAPRVHGRGIAKKLFSMALQRCLEQKPDIREISVNSSLYAFPIYEKLGFRGEYEEQEKNGIRFIPMVYPISS